jgi:hypothetical protein
MMELRLQISLIIGIIFYFIIIFYFLKKNTLTLKYSLLWLFSGFVMLILAIFPFIMDKIINLVGIASVTNGLFAIAVFMILIILMSLTSILSKMNLKNKQLIQSCALLEKRIREIEQKFE